MEYQTPSAETGDGKGKGERGTGKDNKGKGKGRKCKGNTIKDTTKEKEETTKENKGTTTIKGKERGNTETHTRPGTIRLTL